MGVVPDCRGGAESQQEQGQKGDLSQVSTTRRLLPPPRFLCSSSGSCRRLLSSTPSSESWPVSLVSFFRPMVSLFAFVFARTREGHCEDTADAPATPASLLVAIFMLSSVVAFFSESIHRDSDDGANPIILCSERDLRCSLIPSPEHRPRLVSIIQLVPPVHRRHPCPKPVLLVSILPLFVPADTANSDSQVARVHTGTPHRRM